MNKRLLIFVFVTCFFSVSYGQNDKFDSIRNKMKQDFGQFQSATNKAFDDFRKRINEEYANKMREHWQTFQLRDAKPVPKTPDPPSPVVKKDDTPVPTKPQPVDNVVKPLRPQNPAPVKPIPHPDNEAAPFYSFQFHHTPCNVHLDRSMFFSLPDVTEASASDAWKKMSANGFDVVADDCFSHKKKLALNDWGYIELTKTLAEDFLGKGSNEAAIMQVYLLAQSGYKIRMARVNGKLVPLIPFTNNVCGFAFVLIDGEFYYLMSDNKNGGACSIFNEKFSGEKTASLSILQEPQFTESPTSVRTFSSRRYPNATASVSTNRNLIEFYNTYPISSNWDEYARASLSRRVKNSLYPTLKQQITGKTTLQAANILLNFVQTAFDYKTDQDQFGYERPLFGDELFYYPYSDCEDRSILFAILAHDLLQLDVVLLLYPGHLATAVRFNEEVSGYYLMVDGKKYVICDPTYIGAPVGDCMPQFIGTGAEVVKIY